MRVSTSFFILPFAALLPELSSDYAERARIMIYRLILAVVAWALTLAFAFEVIFRGEDALSLASSYVPFAFLLAGHRPYIRTCNHVWNAFGSESGSAPPGRASSSFQIHYGNHSAVSQPVVCFTVFRGNDLHDGFGISDLRERSRITVLLASGSGTNATTDSRSNRWA